MPTLYNDLGIVDDILSDYRLESFEECVDYLVSKKELNREINDKPYSLSEFSELVAINVLKDSELFSILSKCIREKLFIEKGYEHSSLIKKGEY